MNIRPLRLPFLVLALVLASGFALPVLAGQETIVGGVIHVTNGDQPTQGVQKVELEEMWRLGGADDDETIFGIINRVLVDDENNIYLLDAQLSEITVISAEGEVLKTLGGEGDGPGEFRGPRDICFLPDGTIGVLQTFPGKVVKVGLDNSPAGELPLGDPTKGAFYVMRGLRQGGGNVVAGGAEQHVDQSTGLITRETFISSLNAEGLRDRTYASKMVELNAAQLRLDEKEIIDGPDQRFDVGKDGRVVVAIPRNDYEINVYSSDGTLERVISREYESWQRNERAIGIWRRIMETIQTTQAPNAPVSWEDTEPDVEFLRLAGDGQIWILNSRAMWEPPEGVFTFYDVFSPEGEFLKQVHVICPGNPEQDMLFFASDDLAFMVKGFWGAALSQFGGAGSDDDEEPEPMAVVCYKVAG